MIPVEKKNNWMWFNVIGFLSFDWNSFTPLERDKKYIILSAQEVIFGAFRPPAQRGTLLFFQY